MSAELEAAKRILRLIDRCEPVLDAPTKRYLLDKLLCRWAPEGGDLANMVVTVKARR
jgi:hypothetical protein